MEPMKRTADKPAMAMKRNERYGLKLASSVTSTWFFTQSVNAVEVKIRIMALTVESVSASS